MQVENPILGMRRVTAELSHDGIIRQRPVVVLDTDAVMGLDQGDDDELYVVMDDDDEEDVEMLPPTLSAIGPCSSRSDGESQSWNDCRGVGASQGPATRARCTVCQRFQDGSIRLFRWPRDVKTRRKWCSFFMIDENEIALNFDSSCICSWHFDADQFCYSDRKIYWAPGAFPRYKLRRSAVSEPFPWELTNCGTSSGSVATSQTDGKCISRKRRPLPPAPSITVHFRQSKYRVVGKTKHPVAVIASPDNPSVFYEFSYNRTSPIDGTKFYSCLHCRKAKAETRVKDIIRTIHLDGTRLLSRGDPLQGHHFACKPHYDLSRAVQNVGLRSRQLQAPVSVAAKPKVFPSSGQPSSILLTNRTVGFYQKRNVGVRPVRFEECGDGEWEMRPDDVDAPLSVPDACVETEIDDLGETSFEMLEDSIAETVVVKSEGAESCLLGERTDLPTTSRQGDWEKKVPASGSCLRHSYVDAFEKAPLLTPMSTPSPEERFTVESASALQRTSNRRRIQNAGKLCASCYICKCVLGGAEQLAAHLLKHVASAPLCGRCGRNCEPGTVSRRRRLCASCTSRRAFAESRPQLAAAFDTEVRGVVAVSGSEHVLSGTLKLECNDGTRHRTSDQLIVVD